ncbi:MAG: FAD-dependent oxidoreductase [Candidatus Harrisonbacteria bacterium]|nr:FAD-dependent oxidoreductase [Candidatus Harrisonbacteria bacterium]
MMYDLVIVGGGPGGAAAGVYAARKKMKVALITESFGGQSVVSAGIENWIGTKSVSGLDFAKMLEEHLRAQEDIDLLQPDLVEKVEKAKNGFTISTKEGKKLETKTILVTTGSSRKKLGVPGEKELDAKGVSYCSTCDAPIFKNKVVAVIGGGNAGLEAVVDLLAYATKVYLLEYGDKLKGDPITQEKIEKDKKVEIILNAQTTKILGDKFVAGFKYKDLKSGQEKELKLDGIFVEIGAVPNISFVKDLVKLSAYGEIAVDHKTQQTSQPGIWAAGDSSDVLYKQNNISAGDAVKAVLNIYETLNKEGGTRGGYTK